VCVCAASTAGTIVAKEDVGDAVAALLARVPRLQDGRDVVLQVRDIERPPVDEHGHHWLAGGHCQLRQLLLYAGQRNADAVKALALHCVVGADHQHHHVRRRHRRRRFRKPRCAVVNHSTPLPPAPAIVSARWTH
jgi:hypothetical protein